MGNLTQKFTSMFLKSLKGSRVDGSIVEQGFNRKEKIINKIYKLINIITFYLF